MTIISSKDLMGLTASPPLEPEALLRAAHDAATAAILEHFQKGNEEMPFNCGFAWVTVDGRGPFASYCRNQRKQAERGSGAYFGNKGYPKGWTFWCPGKWPSPEVVGCRVYCQDIDFHLAGARAFSSVLERAGLAAYTSSRLD